MVKKQWYCQKCGVKNHLPFEEEYNLVCSKCSTALELKFDHKINWSEFPYNVNGVLRYADIIPVTKESLKEVCDPSHPEFISPVESKNIAKLLGVESFHFIVPIFGPSGTFKDTEAAVAIAKCLDWGINKELSWHSTGNTARAYREYAIKAKLKSHSYFPLSCLSKLRGVEDNNQNEFIAINRPFQEISALAKAESKQNNFFHIAPLVWKIEGKATIAYTIYENLPQTNVIVQTIAGGYGLLGLELGIKRLKALGLKNKDEYRYEAFQIEGADTFARLLPLKRDIFETDLALPINPFEPTLQSTNPLSTYNLVRRVIVETESNIASVKESDVLTARKFFDEECKTLGINISFDDEKSPYISWAGLLDAKNEGRLRKTDRIAFIITGSYKRVGNTPIIDKIID